MSTDILMPALSPTMTEGKLTRWLKKPGDPVAPGDVIAEIETDKATMEVEAVDEGRIGEIRVPEGTEGVPVNAVIATLLADGEDSSAPAQAKAPPSGKTAVPAAAPVAAVPVPQAVRPASGNGHDRAPGGRSRINASPLARRLAREAGLDLDTVRGSGPHGRIIKADLEGLSRGQASGAPARQPAPQGGPAPGKGLDARQYADAVGLRYAARPNSTFRKTIARRLTEAKQTVPHFYLTIDCHLDALLDLRKRYNASAETASGKVSVNDFVIRAAALALRKVPDANVSWTEESILAYDDVDISVAVATPNGLITPIVRGADAKSLRQIAGEMRDLAARARDGKLKPAEYQGGTFSISNLGMFGVREFAAVINPPQSCILAIGNGDARAVVKDGALAVATLMSCTLSVDHRAVDGAVGAEYLAAFKTLVEDPYSLLL